MDIGFETLKNLTEENTVQGKKLGFEDFIVIALAGLVVVLGTNLLIWSIPKSPGQAEYLKKNQTAITIISVTIYVAYLISGVILYLLPTEAIA